ncbi:MAG TPA: hypothetical protein VIX87_12980 [Steroidobacteraceae bacterium]
MSAPLPRGRAQWLSLCVGALALLACWWWGHASPQQSLLSYLSAFLFFTGLALGSLAVLLVQPLTGGAWGEYLRPPLLIAARTLPLQAVAVVPILLGLHVLYPWAQAGAASGDALLRAQSWYLNPTFFVARSIVYFALWLALLAAATRGAAGGSAASARTAAVGLIVYGISTLFAATDWAMSLLPHWHSSTFGMMVAAGWLLGATALAVLCALMVPAPGRPHVPSVAQDLGSLLLMLVLAWSYLAFMQYLTIWIADLPDETAWYIPRTLTSWRALAWFLIAFHFAVPFAVLLSRRAKRRRAWLAGVALLLVVANFADAFWLVVPTFRAHGFSLRWSDLLAAVGVGGLWLCIYLGQLRRVPWPPLPLPLPEGAPDAPAPGQLGDARG